MRNPGWCVLAVLACCVALPGAQVRAEEYQVSYAAGSRDPAGQFMGGTEMRLLVAHAGKLYAGNGYWEDRPGPEGRQPPQILLLDNPGSPWRVDHAFDDRQSNGRLRDLAVGALAEANFAADGSGAKLARPVSLLLASTWDLTGATRVFTRDDSTGTWSAVTLTQNRPDPNFLPQIRAFGFHRDRVTGADLVFAGEMPHGIFAGSYDPVAPGRIRWNGAPELDASGVSDTFSGLAGRLRVSSFAEANGRLYAAVGQQVFERIDGRAPRWGLIYSNPRPGHSETGLRGLTAIRTANGAEALLAAVEGNVPRIIRIDPANGSEVTELEFGDFLARAWGMRPTYVIAAYNDMARIRGQGRPDGLVIGFQAFIPRNIPIASGHSVLDAGYGLADGGAWYLLRWPDGHYDLHQITAEFGHPLVATRSACASPFPGQGDVVYFAGYDAIKVSAHNTAWIARANLSAVSGPAR